MNNPPPSANDRAPHERPGSASVNPLSGGAIGITAVTLATLALGVIAAGIAALVAWVV